MKIITLNIWGGRAGKEKLLEFFDDQKNSVDIFCLQEVWSAPYDHMEGRIAGGVGLANAQIMVHGLQEITKTLSNFNAFFRPHHGDHYGLLMLVNNTLQILEEGEIFVYKHKGFVPEGDLGGHGRNIQYVKLQSQNGIINIINFHGLWNGKGKTDSHDRIVQSQKISDFIKDLKGKIILCGDFNLLPDTQSIKILENAGLKNLIKEYNLTSTRTSYYNKPEKFADYILVSSQVVVKEFKVLPDEVSDHAPLIIEI